MMTDSDRIATVHFKRNITTPEFKIKVIDSFTTTDRLFIKKFRSSNKDLSKYSIKLLQPYIVVKSHCLTVDLET